MFFLLPSTSPQNISEAEMKAIMWFCALDIAKVGWVASCCPTPLFPNPSLGRLNDDMRKEAGQGIVTVLPGADSGSRRNFPSSTVKRKPSETCA